MAEDPVRKRTRRGFKRIERQRRKALAARTARKTAQAQRPPAQTPRERPGPGFPDLPPPPMWPDDRGSGGPRRSGVAVSGDVRRAGMSVFSEAEIAYLQSNTMGRLATIGPDGMPHLVPLTYRFNADEDAIDIGGVDFGTSKKWRDMLQNPQVAFLVDDASPAGAHALEVRGEAEAHFSGGELINPRFPSFQPEFVRIRPRRIVSWGIETEGFFPYARTVR